MRRSITYALIALFVMALIMVPEAVALAQQTFTESDSGRTVSVNIGEPFMIRLAENPSTGYSWNLTYGDGLRLDSNQYIARQVPANIVGSGGNHEWTFTPEKQGTYVISGIYKRPWEPTIGNETRFTLTVVVGSSYGGISRMIIPPMDALTITPVQFPVIPNINDMFLNFPVFDFKID